MGAAWFLDRVEVEVASLGKKCVSLCFCVVITCRLFVADEFNHVYLYHNTRVCVSCVFVCHGLRYVFQCGRWLSRHDDDRQTERDLLPSADTVQDVQVLVVCDTLFQ